MSLQDTIKDVRGCLAALVIDLEKAAGGNKAASQRVRTGTIKLEKIAKKYRKDSIKAEKSGTFKKVSACKKGAPCKTMHAAKAKPAKKVQKVAPKHKVEKKKGR